MDRSSKLTNNNSFQNNHPIHQIQQDFGVYWIVIENDIVHDATNSYYQQIREPNGDIHLRLVKTFKDSKNRGQPEVSQQPDDQDYGE
jgi:hypothetical protein